MNLDALLQLDNVACMSQANVDEGDDGPGRGGLLKLEQDLKEEKEALECNEIFRLVALLEEFDKIA